MKLRRQKVLLCITLAMALLCLGFFAGLYLGSHIGRCRAVVDRHWSDFEQAEDKIALGDTLSNPSVVYRLSIREIWKDPDTKRIKLHFKCDPAKTSGESDGYAVKREDGKWYYKIP
ncbi:MAG: hypothetical protein JW720_16205 [Sedimentisphaerales bacterium]|nr:hypothetical protein [Sedimentisphaerales bacterium]